MIDKIELKVTDRVAFEHMVDGESVTEQGTLISINTRFAKVRTDSGIDYTIGKNRVSLCVSKPHECRRCGEKMPISGNDCVYCSNLDNGASTDAMPRTMDFSSYVIRYQETKLPNGRVTYDNGDNVAQMLRGKGLDDVYAIASDILDTPISDLKSKYGHLNNGQIRMALGNKIRTSVKRKK